MKEIRKVAAAIVGGVISILGVIMAAAWIALAFVAPFAGLKFCILLWQTNDKKGVDIMLKRLEVIKYENRTD